MVLVKEKNNFDSVSEKSKITSNK